MAVVHGSEAVRVDSNQSWPQASQHSAQTSAGPGSTGGAGQPGGDRLLSRIGRSCIGQPEVPRTQHIRAPQLQRRTQSARPVWGFGVRRRPLRRRFSDRRQHRCERVRLVDVRARGELRSLHLVLRRVGLPAGPTRLPRQHPRDHRAARRAPVDPSRRPDTAMAARLQGLRRLHHGHRPQWINHDVYRPCARVPPR